MHFQTWQDKAGTAPPLTDPKTGPPCPDLSGRAKPFQTNLISLCSVSRPAQTEGIA
jgi:hypothetical protein